MTRFTTFRSCTARTAVAGTALRVGKNTLLTLAIGVCTISLLAGCSKSPPADGNPPAATARPGDDTPRSADLATQKKLDDEKRDADLKRELASFRTAMLDRNYDSAKTFLVNALVLAPSDQAVLDAQRDYQNAIQARDATQSGPAVTAQRQDEYQARIRAGNDAIQARRYDDAAQAFSTAQLLNQNDPAAQNLMLQVQKSREEQRDAWRQYRAAKDAGDYYAASNALERFALLSPNDDYRIAQARTDLEALRTARPLPAGRRTAEFDARVREGNAAMTDKRYDDAVRAYGYARDLNPGDSTITTLISQATKSQDDLRRALGRVRRSLADRDLTGARRAYKDAYALAPNDLSVRQARLELESAEFAGSPVRPLPIGTGPSTTPLPLPSDSATRSRLLGQYNEYVKSGREAMKGKRYDDAVRNFDAANRLLPDQKEAADLLQQARSKAGTATTAKPGKETTSSPQVRQHLDTFHAALRGNRLDEAARALDEARRLAPQDSQVLKAVKELEKAKKKPTKK